MNNDEVENSDLNVNQKEMSPESRFIFDLINCVNRAYVAGLAARNLEQEKRDE